VVKIFGGGSQAAVTDVFVDNFRIQPVGQLESDEGMTHVVNLGIGNTGFLEIAVDGGSDVSDKQGFACFGNKKMVIFGLGADGQKVLDGGKSGFGQRYGAGGVVFQNTDENLILFDVVQAEIGKLGNAHAGLQKEFDNGTDADVQATGVTEVFDFSGGENVRRFVIQFGMGERGGGVGGDELGLVEELEKGLKGVDFAADALGSIALGSQAGYKLLQVLRKDGRSLGDAVGFKKGTKLLEITRVGDDCRRGAFLVF